MQLPRRRTSGIRAVMCLICWTTYRAATAATPALPAPCLAGTCGSNASKFVTSGAATALSSGNSLTVHQSSNTAILNWSSFNIGANGTVAFQQPGASSVALNRIFQASPSQIIGNLTANGQVYLLNANGFLFGSTARVNVGSLTVSSLPLTLDDAHFANGILSPLQSGTDKAAFDAAKDPLVAGGRMSVVDANGKAVLDANGNPIPVQVVVQPGAQITAADQGRILLAGQSITNGGALTAPDGQVILAAGTQIFLQADNDPSVRGLVVEVDGATTTSATGASSTNTAWNQLSGLLSAPRGNITMVGLAVNQEGRISATTSVSANGSIRLEAAGGATPGGTLGNQTVASTQGGALTIGAQSQMQILPDASGGTAVPDQSQLISSITLLGEQVVLKGGSIVAPGATLTAIAAANPSNAAVVADATKPFVVAGVTAVPDANARLRIDPGTTIDLSGSTASLPVTANLVEAQLRSSELADDPTQRDGALHGVTVYVDRRNGSPPIANLAGEIAAVPESIAQRTETGGHAIFQSEGDAILAQGATVNVSGGSSTYAGGQLQTSYLVAANGQLVPIATANPLLTYTGVVNPTFTQSFNSWGVQDVLPTAGLSTYQPGYVQGAAAGSIQFAAPSLLLQGAVQGSAINGLFQRTPSTAVSGGQLIIGIPAGIQNSGAAFNYLAPDVRLTQSSTPIVVADTASIPGPLTLDLLPSYLTSSGFTSTQIYSNGNVTLPPGTPLLLPAGGTLAVTAASVDVLSAITAPNGALSFQNVATVPGAVAAPTRLGVSVGDDVVLDVRGLWTNDSPLFGASALTAGQTWQNGGSINLGVSSPGALLSLGNDVALHASAGAWQQASGTVVAGSGGTISLNDGALAGGLAVGNNLTVDAFGVNGSKGGAFILSAPRLIIEPKPGVAGAAGSAWTTAQTVDDASTATDGFFQIFPNLFSDFGFQNVSLSSVGLVSPLAATSNVVSVYGGTQIDATVRSVLLGLNAQSTPSASNVNGLGSVVLLPAYQQPAESVSLTALPPVAGINTAPAGSTSAGDVAIGAGAAITTGVGGSITLTGLDSLLVDGTLRAPGGTISLHVVSPTVNDGTYSNYELGFLANQRIELGSGGILDVAGTLVSTPSTQGLSLGTVAAGGQVNLLADRGAVFTDPGSRIAINGASGALDVLQSNGAYVREVAASAGGAFTVHSGESISLLGALEAAAGSGGTSGAAAAGSLDLALTRDESWWSTSNIAASNSFNQAPLTIDLEPTVPATVPRPSANSNQAALGAAQLARSGLDALRIEAGGAVELSSALSLALGRQLVIDAPVIAANVGTQASLSAPYLELGNQLSTTATLPNTAVASRGTGSLIFSGAEIDLLGTTVFQGTSTVQFASSGDLLLRGTAVGSGATTVLTGGVSVEGKLSLSAARIYPVTATSFSLNALEDSATGIPGTVTLGQTGANPGTPLSAAGAVSITAYDIASAGTLYAPFGTIALSASHALTLGDGSLTSVSGEGLTIPYGSTLFGGQQWTYSAGSLPAIIAGVPSRTVSLTAPNVTIGSQATISLAGGGDLTAYEWVPGPGGSTDKLAPATVAGPASTPGLYAVLPSTRGLAAPQDPQNTDSSLQAGETVYLSGGAGLAAGYYPLLPARYGLQPGAFLVQIEPTYQSAAGGSLGALADGTPVVAGFLSYGSTGLHQTPGYTGFALHPGSYGSQLATYKVSEASTFFAAAATLAGAARPTLPADAGSLSIAITNVPGSAGSLNATGEVVTTAATGGVAAAIQITAADLFVGTPSSAQPVDSVSVSSATLASWQPGSLLLGGAVTAQPATPATGLSPAPSSSTVNVVANSVTVGTGTALTAGQIMLVANQSIDVQNGAILQSTSASTGTAPTSLPTEQSILFGGGNPAVVAVSDLNWLIPSRTGGASPVGAGTVAIDAGATLASRGSLTIDGVGGVTVNGSLSGAGAEWSVGSSRIALGGAPAASTGAGMGDGWTISSALLAQMNGAAAVRLASTGALDLLAPISLGVANGAPTLGALTLQASSLNNLSGSNAAASEFGAKTLTLEGSGAAAAAPTVGGPGSQLTLLGGQLDVGPSLLAINGFAVTRATVSGAVIGQGSGGLLVGGDLAITAAGITAATAADTRLIATGSLSVAPSATSTTTLPVLLGGSLTLSGATLDIAGTVTAPSGNITLNSSGNLTVNSGGLISVAGTVVPIGNQLSAAPGGFLTATAGGNLSLNSGAILDVAGADSVAAGSLALTAGGTATLGATLIGAGGAAAAGGSFGLDAGSLASPGGGGNPLSLLATSLGSTIPGSGGFDHAIDLRVRGGNLTLDSQSALVANSVVVTDDSGKITVLGQIAATSGSQRGSLSLFGGGGVELAAGGVLRADGAGTGAGGSIEVGAGQLVTDATGLVSGYNNGSISLDAGSLISAAGKGGNGVLLLRAPALLNSHDVGINALAANTSAIGTIVVEPVMVFNVADATLFSSATLPTLGDFQNLSTPIGSFMSVAAPGIAARLVAASGTPLLVQAGVEIVAPGALTLPQSGLDLAASADPSVNGLNWHFNGLPVDLTVRAAGTINVAGTISDGFIMQSIGDANAPLQPSLASGLSASLRFVAGADLASSNPLTALPSPSGADLILAPGAVIRTGTGDLDLVASRNITLGAGAAAYTAGTPAISPGGTATQPYPGVSTDVGLTAPNSDGNGDTLTYGIVVPGSDLLMSFPTAGGNLLVQAGGDISNQNPVSAGGVTGWQLREGGDVSTPSTPTQWGVNLNAYNWNFGTLGGGDVKIVAAGSATNLSAAVADSLLPQALGATPVYVTSGGLSLVAGKDIGSAQVFVADGTGQVRAGGALLATLTSAKDGDPLVGSAFYLQDSAIDVTARLGAVIDGAFNPTAFIQPKSAGTPLAGSFYSYGDASALNVETVTGNLVFGTGSGSLGTGVNQTLLGLTLNNANNTAVRGSFPASLALQALSGDLVFGPNIGAGGTVTLFPSATGQIDLLAARDILGNGTTQGRLILSDPAAGSVATVTSPQGTTAINSPLFSGDIHSGDTTPTLVAAGGSIEELFLVSSKASRVIAGQNILDLTYQGQNLNAGDDTLFSAGNDLSYSNAYVGNAIAVGGPGRVDLLAGRNIGLGFSAGVVTTGNLTNPNLPTAQGADLTLFTGLGSTPHYSDFLTTIVAPVTKYQTELVSYVEGLQGGEGLSFAAAQTAFNGLSIDQQRPFIDSVFFNELSQSGLAANTVPGAGFKQGYAAIDALYPGSRTAAAGSIAGSYAGNLTLEFSRIYTLSGGDITLVVPGGQIDVGLANPPATFSSRPASTLGIVAEGTGNVNIYTKGDVNVNSSRIFTLGGGNVLIWSDEGSIDAGLGAKTSVSAPPPSILISSTGQVTLNFAGAAEGSGIRTIQTEPTTPPGNVDLIAPVGTVNAGDAGIGSSGNINIAAQSVIGVSNINFGGTATGVPAQVSGIGASLSGASSAATGATTASTSAVQSNSSEKETAAPLAQTALTWLDVFVTGLGEENCKADDIDCLKRQKTPTR